jgi:hypothetical protein
VFLGLMLALPASLLGQRTRDQARLMLTVSPGYVSGRDLWSVPNQPVQRADVADTFALERRIRDNIGLSFSGAYFPGDHLGFSVEAQLLGLGYGDQCRLAFASGSPITASTCQSIQGAEKSATAVLISTGAIWRFNSRKLISPYLRGQGGLLISSQSSLRTIGTTNEGAILIVYDDNRNTRVSPGLVVGAGFTAPIAQSYQLRWEVRDHFVGVSRVTGAVSPDGSIPPHKVSYKHLFSLMIGFDVVLERRRGRRY